MIEKMRLLTLIVPEADRVSAVEKLRDAFRPDPNREDKTLFEKESQYF